MGLYAREARDTSSIVNSNKKANSRGDSFGMIASYRSYLLSRPHLSVRQDLCNLHVSQELQSTDSLHGKKSGSKHACPMGSACDACPRNTFGPDCVPCPKCSSAPGDSQGRCDDGQFGTGSCVNAADAGRIAFTKCLDLTKPCPVQFHETPGNLVMTTLFTTKVDPQRGYLQNCSLSDTKWYSSVKELGFSALVLHDCLSQEDAVKLQSDQVRFLRVRVRDDMSINDFRFVLHYGVLSGQVQDSAAAQAIELNYRWRPTVQKVLMTDLFDVHFTGNPFQIIFGNRYHVYVGNEDNAPTTPKSGEWNSLMMYLGSRCSELDTHVLQSHGTNMTGQLLNSGIVGGTISPVLSLLRLMYLHMISSKASVRDANCNMFVLNKCIHDLFAIDSVFTGYPLHNTFKGGETSPHAYIIHKQRE